MLKSIGIIGYGFVGKACHTAFRHNTKPVVVDPLYSQTTVSDLVAADPTVVFVAINAPTLEDGSVDASVIYTVLGELAEAQYSGVVVLKSTLPPSTIDDLYNKFAKDKLFGKTGPLRLVYSPEFLREAHWEEDAVNPKMIILAGNYDDCKFVQTLYQNHSHVMYTRYYITDYKEAALIKYSINAFLAVKVVFFNQIHQLYTDINEGFPPHPETWDVFVQMLSTDPRMGNSHMQVPGPGGEYGYGGSCFPKDVRAILHEDKNNRLSVLSEVELANTKIRLRGRVDSLRE